MSTLVIAVLTLSGVVVLAAVSVLALLLPEDEDPPIDWRTPQTTPCDHGHIDCPTCGSS